MKLSDLLGKVTGLDAKVAATEKALAEALNKISSQAEEIKQLSARADDSDEDGDKLDELLEELRQILNEKAADANQDEDASEEDDSDDSDDSSDEDDAEDAAGDDDEEMKSKGKASAKVKTAKSLLNLAKTVVAKKAKAESSVGKKVIQTIAAIGIPAPVQTKVEGQQPALKGRDRVVAAFNEQLKEK